MESKHIKKVDFSEKELIILYNYIPRLIEKSAIFSQLIPQLLLIVVIIN